MIRKARNGAGFFETTDTLETVAARPLPWFSGLETPTLPVVAARERDLA
jgi:hypothetical protein